MVSFELAPGLVNKGLSLNLFESQNLKLMNQFAIFEFVSVFLFKYVFVFYYKPTAKAQAIKTSRWLNSILASQQEGVQSVCSLPVSPVSEWVFPRGLRFPQSTNNMHNPPAGDGPRARFCGDPCSYRWPQWHRRMG